MFLDYKTAFVCSSGNVCCFCLGFCLTQEHPAVVEIVGVGDKLVVIFFHIYYIFAGWLVLRFLLFSLSLCCFAAFASGRCYYAAI